MHSNVGSAVVVNRKRLLDALGICGYVVPSKSPMPILECAKVRCSSGTVDVEATNLDFGVKVSLTSNGHIGNGENQEQFALTLRCKNVQKYLKSLKSDTVTISSSNNTYKTVVTIFDNNGNTATFESSHVDDFPTIPQKQVLLCTLTLQEFVALFEPVSYAAIPYKEDTNRLALKGCLVIFDSERVVAMATNGYRLAANSIEKHTDVTGQYLLYAQAINLALKLLQKSKGNTAVTLWLCDENTHMAIDLGNVEIVSRIISEEYPNVERAIPQDKYFPYSITADRRQAKQALETAYGACENKYDAFVTLESEDGSLTLRTDYSVSKIPAVSNIPYRITFRLKYLVEALEHIRADKVTLRLGEDDKCAGLIKNDRLCYVVMPVAAQCTKG